MQHNELHIQEIEQILTLVTLILNQNYFYHDNKYYEQPSGLAMGAPTSALLADFFLQYI
jgi:glycine/serine hydroxymethyltransferase